MFREEYGPGTEFDDCKLIKSRLNKALRAAIRKVKTAVSGSLECSRFRPFLNSINNDRIKKILVSPDALTARIALCDFSCAKTLTSQITENTVVLMEQAINRMENGRTDDN
jgi:hypothetical protein